MAENTIEIKFQATNADKLKKAIDSLDKATKSLISSQAHLSKTGKKVIDHQSKQTDALRKMNVRLKALGGSLRKSGISTDLLTKAQKGNAVSLQKVRIQVAKYERKLKGLNVQTKVAEHRTRILGGTIAVLRSKLLLVNFVSAMFLNTLRKMATAGATAESLGTAFDTLSGKIEDSSIVLNKLKQATNDTMSEFDLFKQANNAMILGVATNSDTMSEMFDIAQRLGRALGRDTASSVESLITGIGRQSRLMLDNIGIIVKADEAYEKFAKTNNTTADALTDAQKKQAFLNATMESARQKVKTLGDEVKSSRDVIDEMTSSASNLATEFGQFLEPVTNDVAKSFTKLFNAGTRLLKGEKEQIDNTKEINTLLMLRAELTGENEKITKEYVEASNLFKDSALEESSIQKEMVGLTLSQIDARLKSLGVDKLKAETIDGLIKKEIGLSAIIEQVNNDNLASDQHYFNQRKEIITKHIEENSILFNSLSLGYDQFVDTLVDSEMTGKERREKIWEATKNGFIKFTAEIIKEKIKQTAIEASLDKSSLASATLANAGKSAVQLAGAIAGYIRSAFQTTPWFIATPMALAGGAFMLDLFKKQTAKIGSSAGSGLPFFEQGGLVGGRRHSQGGTMIEAERGEFVMSRNAVQAIGVETLNQMNQGGGGGLTVNVTAPLVDETVIDSIIPAIQKAQRMNLA